MAKSCGSVSNGRVFWITSIALVGLYFCEICWLRCLAYKNKPLLSRTPGDGLQGRHYGLMAAITQPRSGKSLTYKCSSMLCLKLPDVRWPQKYPQELYDRKVLHDWYTPYMAGSRYYTVQSETNMQCTLTYSVVKISLEHRSDSKLKIDTSNLTLMGKLEYMTVLWHWIGYYCFGILDLNIFFVTFVKINPNYVNVHDITDVLRN